MRAVIRYAKECRDELGKVIWPSKRQLWEHTLLVIGVSVVLAAFLGVVDYLSTLGFEQFLKLR